MDCRPGVRIRVRVRLRVRVRGRLGLRVRAGIRIRAQGSGLSDRNYLKPHPRN